jgi:hypothetical protein
LRMSKLGSSSSSMELPRQLWCKAITDQLHDTICSYQPHVGDHFVYEVAWTRKLPSSYTVKIAPTCGTLAPTLQDRRLQGDTVSSRCSHHVQYGPSYRVTGSQDSGGEEEPGAEIVVQAAESRQAMRERCGILTALILAKLSAVPIFELVAADIRASAEKHNSRRSNGITVWCV